MKKRPLYSTSTQDQRRFIRKWRSKIMSGNIEDLKISDTTREAIKKLFAKLIKLEPKWRTC